MMSVDFNYYHIMDSFTFPHAPTSYSKRRTQKPGSDFDINAALHNNCGGRKLPGSSVQSYIQLASLMTVFYGSGKLVLENFLQNQAENWTEMANLVDTCINYGNTSLGKLSEKDLAAYVNHGVSLQQDYFKKMVEVRGDGLFKNLNRWLSIFSVKITFRIGIFMVCHNTEWSLLIGYKPIDDEDDCVWLTINPKTDETLAYTRTPEEIKKFFKSIDSKVIPVLPKSSEDYKVFDKSLQMLEYLEKKKDKNPFEMAKNHGFGCSRQDLTPDTFLEAICNNKGWKFKDNIDMCHCILRLLPDVNKKREGLLQLRDKKTKTVVWKKDKESKRKLMKLGLIVATPFTEDKNKMIAIVNPVL